LLFRIERVRCIKIQSQQISPEILVEDTLQLFLIDGIHYINIGNKFAYELNQTIPCLAMSSGYYILPGIDNTYFGIIFPETIPPIYCERFEEKISQICILKSSVTKPSIIEDPDDELQDQLVVQPTVTITKESQITIFTEDRIHSVAQTVNVSGQWVSHGILVGADFLSKRITSSAEKFKDLIEPSENPTQVPETIKNTLRIAKQITPHVVELSGMFVNTVHTVVKGVGYLAADQIKNKIQTKHNVDFNDPRIVAAKNLGKVSAHAIVSIWNSLEEAGMTLLNSTGKAVVNIVHHKYGEEAGKVTQDGFAVAQDVVKTTTTLKTMGVKGLVRIAAKESTKTLIGNDPTISSGPQITAELTENEFDELVLPPSDLQSLAIDIDSDDDDAH